MIWQNIKILEQAKEIDALKWRMDYLERHLGINHDPGPPPPRPDPRSDPHV